MKRTTLAAAAFGAVVLTGCGGQGIEGTWCPEGETGHMVVKDGKMTASTGMTATYTLSGKTVTATEPDGKTTNLILVEDGSLGVENEPEMKFTRCTPTP